MLATKDCNSSIVKLVGFFCDIGTLCGVLKDFHNVETEKMAEVKLEENQFCSLKMTITAFLSIDFCQITGGYYN